MPILATEVFPICFTLRLVTESAVSPIKNIHYASLPLCLSQAPRKYITGSARGEHCLPSCEDYGGAWFPRFFACLPTRLFMVGGLTAGQFAIYGDIKKALGMLLLVFLSVPN